MVLPVPLPLTLSFHVSPEQGDELLIECNYQTLDRDSMTFVSVSPHHEHKDFSSRKQLRQGCGHPVTDYPS